MKTKIKLNINEEFISVVFPEAKNLNSFPRKKKKKMKKLIVKKIHSLFEEFIKTENQ